jgi:uncharacterized protein
MSNPVVHFEMPYEDPNRAAEFYKKAFGWQGQHMGPEMGNYVVMSTTETDPKTQQATTPGAINGGLFKKSEKNNLPSVVISVDDIQAAMKKVADAGGKIIGGQTPGVPDEIPGIGLWISFQDTEGNRVSMLQPKGV